MGIMSAIGTVLRLILLIVQAILERDKTKKEAMKEAVTEVKDGLKKNDPSRITAGFGKLKRL